MRKLLFTWVFAAAASATLYATPVDVCSGPGTSTTVTIQGLGDLDEAGYLCGDKLFNNFTGDAPAGTITFFQTAANNFRFFYSPDGGSTTATFSLNFQVSVSGSNDILSQAVAQMFSGPSLPNDSTATSSGTNGTSTQSNMIADASGNGQINVINYNLVDNVTTSVISFSYNPNGNGGDFIGGNLQSYEVALTQAARSTVPEPGSLALLGSGLVGLGLFARRRSRKQ